MPTTMTNVKRIPQKGEIWKAECFSGRIWLFRSAGGSSEELTLHDGAYCMYDGGRSEFHDRVSHRTGRRITSNSHIVLLKPANENERVIFKRFVGE